MFSTATETLCSRAFRKGPTPQGFSGLSSSDGTVVTGQPISSTAPDGVNHRWDLESEEIPTSMIVWYHI